MRKNANTIVSNPKFVATNTLNILGLADPCNDDSEMKIEETKKVSMRLNFPPSVNTYWRNSSRGVYLSERAMDYKLHVIEVVGHRTEPIYPTEQLKICMYLSPPDLRKRDLDNFAGKAIFDALKSANVVTDDDQFKHIESRMNPADEKKKGYCDVLIEEV